MAGQAPGVLDLLGQVFSSERISTKEALSRVGAVPARGVIDPYDVAQQLGGPVYAAAVSESLGYAHLRDERPVDAGSLALDQLAARLGLKTNFTGRLGPRTMVYLLAPGVTYKQEMAPSLAAARRSRIHQVWRYPHGRLGYS